MVHDKIDYIVMLISHLAKRMNLPTRETYDFLSSAGGIDFCERHYGIMHTLSLEDNIESLLSFCRRNKDSI